MRSSSRLSVTSSKPCPTFTPSCTICQNPPSSTVLSGSLAACQTSRSIESSSSLSLIRTTEIFLAFSSTTKSSFKRSDHLPYASPARLGGRSLLARGRSQPSFRASSSDPLRLRRSSTALKSLERSRMAISLPVTTVKSRMFAICKSWSASSKCQDRQDLDQEVVLTSLAAFAHLITGSSRFASPISIHSKISPRTQTFSTPPSPILSKLSYSIEPASTLRPLATTGTLRYFEKVSYHDVDRRHQVALSVG